MKLLASVVKILLILIIPFFILMSSIRILFNPSLLQVEYNVPNFPADPYGFNKEDRIKWANVSLDFLLNNQDLSYFDNLKLPDGSPLYNQRELSHMWDVKLLLQKMITAWSILGVMLLLAGIVSWRIKSLRSYFGVLSQGGWLTLIVIALILAGVALSFDWLFTEFHRIFFTGDTWLFLYSDTFIRLFPMQFWQDAFIAGGALAIVFGLILGFGGRALSRSQ
jgi:integral membrane protein (TIGR01906 family)